MTLIHPPRVKYRFPRPYLLSNSAGIASGMVALETKFNIVYIIRTIAALTTKPHFSPFPWTHARIEPSTYIISEIPQ